jgi:hypothetical protein
MRPQNKQDKGDKLLTDIDIMEQLIHALKTTAPKLATSLGYKSKSTIYLILKGDNRITEDMITKICGTYPEVNYWFLRKGQMPILLDKNTAKVQGTILGTGEGGENPVVLLTEIRDLLRELVGQGRVPQE